jgi:hypothetical protein
MAIPKGYLRLEGSELRIAKDAQWIGPEDSAKTLSAVIRVNEQGRKQIAAFLAAQGLRTAVTGRTDEIVVIGMAAQINAAFGIELVLHKWAGQIWRCYEGFLHLPSEIANLVASVVGLAEHGGPWINPGGVAGNEPTQGGKRPIRVVALWTVPHAGPSGPVNPANYAMVSSFDIDWLNTAGFQTMLDNFAASPGAFQTVRVMKALNSGTAELGSIITDLPPAGDSVWAFGAAPPDPASPSAFSATISALTELTKRGLTPYVVLGFFPDGVYTGTVGGLPPKTDFDAPTAYQNSTFGPDPGYIAANPGDWPIILKNWNKLIQAFFQTLSNTFGNSISSWLFEVWNEPDNPQFWIPDTQPTNALGWPTSGNPPLYYYCQLYQETVSAIASAGLGFNVRVGGPAIMANTFDLSETGNQSDLEIALPIFLNFVFSGGISTSSSPPPLQCDFISLHVKGDWTEQLLPDVTAVINTMESAVSTFMSNPAYGGYFDNKPVINDESDMRVGDQVPFYPRMTSQFAAWLTALMIANDSLTSEYATKGGAQFAGGSDNAHLELVGWQQATSALSGEISFGQQRSIMTAASSWNPGTVSAPLCAQDLVKVPVYNFYELLRLLGDQHGVFISGQQNFYPTDPNSDLFSAITFAAPGGALAYVCWVFCVYPTSVPSNGKPPTPPSWSTNVEVIDLPASWTKVNWVQFQIGPAASADTDDNSFTVAQTSQPEPVPPVPTMENPMTGTWQYDMPTPPTQVSLSNPAFNAANIRLVQEMSLVQYEQGVSISSGVWQTPAAVDFEPYSSIAFWITPYDPNSTPVTPVQASYKLPDGTVVLIAIAQQVGNNVVLQWHYPETDPTYGSFFYFEVVRNETTISPVPKITKGGVSVRSFALRAEMWVDTAVAPGTYTYSISAVTASGVHSSPLTTTLTI